MGRPEFPIAAATSEELVEIYRHTGRPEDFEQIVRRFAGLVLSECRRAASNGHDAEDASQLTFLALAMEIKSGTEILRVGAWLQRVARRQALKIVRSRGRRRRREDAVRRTELFSTDLARPIDQQTCAGIVRDAIDALPEQYRMPVVQHYFGGMPLELIAREMKLTRSAVATRLHRGRKLLADRLSRCGFHYDGETLGATLNAAAAVIVPTTVINAVVQSLSGAGSIGIPTGLAVSATGLPLMAAAPALATSTLPSALGGILHAIFSGQMQRRVAALVLAASIAIGGSGAIVGAGTKLLQHVGMPTLPLPDASQMLHWFGDLLKRAVLPEVSQITPQTPAAPDIGSATPLATATVRPGASAVPPVVAFHALDRDAPVRADAQPARLVSVEWPETATITAIPAGTFEIAGPMALVQQSAATSTLSPWARPDDATLTARPSELSPVPEPALLAMGLLPAIFCFKRRRA